MKKFIKQKNIKNKTLIIFSAIVLIFVSTFIFTKIAKAVDFTNILIKGGGFPSVYSSQVRGGFHSVDNITGVNTATTDGLLAIPCYLRQEGMLVWVKNANGSGTSKTYQLIKNGLVSTENQIGCWDNDNNSTTASVPIGYNSEGKTVVAIPSTPIDFVGNNNPNTIYDSATTEDGVWREFDFDGGGIEITNIDIINANTINNQYLANNTYTYTCTAPGSCGWTQSVWNTVPASFGTDFIKDIYNAYDKRVGIRVGTSSPDLNPATQDLTIGEDKGFNGSTPATSPERGGIAVQMRTPTIISATLTTAGLGDLNGSYDFFLTAEDSAGGVTIGSNTVTCVTSHACSVAWSPIPGAANYRIYVNKSSGSFSSFYVKVPGNNSSYVVNFDSPTSYSLPVTATLAPFVKPSATTAYVNKISADNTSWFSGGSFLLGKDPLSSINNPVTGDTGLTPKLEVQDNGGGDLGSTLTNYLGVIKSIVIGSKASSSLFNKSGAHFWASNQTPSPSSSFTQDATDNGAGAIFYDRGTDGTETADSQSKGRFKISQAGNPGFCDLYPEGSTASSTLKWNDATKCWEASQGTTDNLWEYSLPLNTIRNITTAPITSITTLTLSSLIGASALGVGDGQALIYGGTPIGGDICYKKLTGEVGRCGASYTLPTVSITPGTAPAGYPAYAEPYNAGCDLPSLMPVTFGAAGGVNATNHDITGANSYMSANFNGAEVVDPSTSIASPIIEGPYGGTYARKIYTGFVTTGLSGITKKLVDISGDYIVPTPYSPGILNDTATDSFSVSWRNISYVGSSPNASIVSKNDLSNLTVIEGSTGFHRDPAILANTIPAGSYLYYLVPDLSVFNPVSTKGCLTPGIDLCNMALPDSGPSGGSPFWSTTVSSLSNVQNSCVPSGVGSNITYKVYRRNLPQTVGVNIFGAD